MGLYDQIMGRGANPAAPGAGAVTDPLDLPQLTPELYSQLWPSGAPTVTPGDAGSTGTPGTQTVGQGPLANKPLPVSDGNGKVDRIVAAAKSLVGTPYVWGGTGTAGVDCSGLVQLAYKAVGINLPRVSYQQANAGRRVDVGSLEPGDLVAWDNSTRNNGADHIAVYIGHGQIVEAPRPGTNVRIRKLGSNEGAWGVRILGGNRA